MPDYRSMFDNRFIFAFDLKGKDVTLTIARVECAELMNESMKKSKKPVVYFEELLRRTPSDTRGLAINKTNGKTLCALYGPLTEAWVGKKVTIYPTKTKFGRDNVDCIRIRPVVPGANASGGTIEAPPAEPPPQQREPGEEG